MAEKRKPKKTKSVSWMPDWISIMWKAMTHSSKGYRYYSLRRTGVGEDRRQDKIDAERLGIPPAFRRYQRQYS